MKSRSVLRSLSIVPVVVGLVMTVTASTASADTKRVPASSPDVTLTGYCTFPVFVHTAKDKEYNTSTILADGTRVEKTEGSLFVTFTNVNTGNAITVNSSGPGVITYFPDGTITVEEEGSDANLWNAQAQAAFGLAGLELTSGHLDFTRDPSGNFTSYSLAGHSVDGCALLS
jgi:hypothetical protein